VNRKIVVLRSRDRHGQTSTSARNPDTSSSTPHSAPASSHPLGIRTKHLLHFHRTSKPAWDVPTISSRSRPIPWTVSSEDSHRAARMKTPVISSLFSARLVACPMTFVPTNAMQNWSASHMGLLWVCLAFACALALVQSAKPSPEPLESSAADGVLAQLDDAARHA
jgi:hypothetical protein